MFHFNELKGCLKEAVEGGWGLTLTHSVPFFCSHTKPSKRMTSRHTHRVFLCEYSVVRIKSAGKEVTSPALTRKIQLDLTLLKGFLLVLPGFPPLLLATLPEGCSVEFPVNLSIHAYLF